MISRHTPTHFIPSSAHLTAQIDAAMAKFDAAREQAILAKEAREMERRVRAQTNAAKARHYFNIQHGRA